MKIRDFVKSRAGRIFYNFAYCWGACLVILGAVFKIAHMPFDSILLMIGLFTEVFIFFISGFDVPDQGYEWERVFPHLKGDSKADIDLEASLKEARKQYEAGIKVIEARVSELDKAYRAQVEKMNAMTESIRPEAIVQMQKETMEMTRLLKELNGKYSKMLEAMDSRR